MEMNKCKDCGKMFDLDEEGVIVNDVDGHGFCLCDTCADAECFAGRVISCQGCGNYFTADILHDEEIEGETFTPCPSCGADVVEGWSREEFAEEYKPRRYVAIVRGPNSSRGYIVRVRPGENPLKKLADRLNLKYTDTIYIAESILDEDEF